MERASTTRDGTPSAIRRSVRACLTCRKTKNRCSGECPCERCSRLGKDCQFDRPDPTDGNSSRMQEEVDTLRAALARTVAALRERGHLPSDFSAFDSENGRHVSFADPSPSDTGAIRVSEGVEHSRKRSRGDSSASPRTGPDAAGSASPHSSLPYRAPDYPLKPYRFQLFESRAVSPVDDGLDLPNTAMQTEFEAVHSNAFSDRSNSRTLREPAPPPAFRNVIELQIISASEAEQLFAFYTTYCHPFFPILDLQTDTFESLSRGFPWTLNSCLFVACRAQVGSNPPTPLLERLMDEAQGIARASLFSITTQTADIQAMAILAAFSINAVLPASHAMSMGVEFQLHVALSTLSRNSRHFSPEDELGLAHGARTWLHLIVLQHSSGRGKGKSLRVVDNDSICRERLLGLTHHPSSNAFDVGLAAQVELITLQAHADASLAMLNSLRDFSTQGAGIIKGYCKDIQKLHIAWDLELNGRASDPVTPFVSRCMARTFKQAELEVIVGGIRGRSIRRALTDLTFRDLVVQARSLAMENLELLSGTGDSLYCMTHSMVLEASFCALLILKVTKVLPGGIELEKMIREIRSLSEMLQKTPGGEIFSRIVGSALSQAVPSVEAQDSTTSGAAPPIGLQELLIATQAPSMPNWLTVDNLNFDLDWPQIVPESQDFGWASGAPPNFNF
ncbi:hypothetical protein BCR35DRAFT_353627 [Leucosporidium creatinivorum]|uniref:Zn(2)-C6 fungal-type domain-containing protein n=1 Tax=Leucosporidium creatinivorum TaxID=106004 RepID=A0A1Y2EUS5_9BASI|nr:hypothetical protein BCR35DRAFT_353627 [Leucosporidium creatinivorum]